MGGHSTERAVESVRSIRSALPSTYCGRMIGLLTHYFYKSQEELRKISKGKKPHKTAYARLLQKAAHALAEVSR